MKRNACYWRNFCFIVHVVRNGNFLKMCVSEIRVKRISVNQGVGVFRYVWSKIEVFNAKNEDFWHWLFNKMALHSNGEELSIFYLIFPYNFWQNIKSKLYVKLFTQNRTEIHKNQQCAVLMPSPHTPLQLAAAAV